MADGWDRINPGEIEMYLRQGQLRKLEFSQRCYTTKGGPHTTGDTKGKPHIIVWGQLPSVPRKRAHFLEILRHRSTRNNRALAVRLRRSSFLMVGFTLFRRPRGGLLAEMKSDVVMGCETQINRVSI